MPLMRLIALTLCVLATGGVVGCQAASNATATSGKVIDNAAVNGANQLVGARLPEILNAGDEKLVVALSDIEVVLTSPRDAHDFAEVTYVISLEDESSYHLQFTSAADREDYVARVSFKRLYRGTYTVKAFGDKGTEPFATGRFRITEEGF